MTHDAPAYGLRLLVLVNVAVCAYSFTRPRTTRDWRSSQYVAFIVIMLGFLLTFGMFPVLTFAYVRLAKREENEARLAFGDRYARYATETPAFIPRLGSFRSRSVAPRQAGR